MYRVVYRIHTLNLRYILYRRNTSLVFYLKWKLIKFKTLLNLLHPWVLKASLHYPRLDWSQVVSEAIVLCPLLHEWGFMHCSNNGSAASKPLTGDLKGYPTLCNNAHSDGGSAAHTFTRPSANRTGSCQHSWVDPAALSEVAPSLRDHTGTN